MPSVYNTLAPNNAINNVSRRFIENFYTKCVDLRIFTTDFSNEVVEFGAQVSVALNGIRTASVRSDATTAYVSNPTAVTNTTAYLNQDVYDQAEFTNVDYSKANVNLIRSQVIPAAQAMALEIQNLAFANITAGNYPSNFVSTSGNFTYANLCALSTQSKLANWGSEKYLVLHPSYVQTLLQANQITNSLIPKTPELAITESYIARIGGFEVFESVSVPTSGAFTGFACTPSAMLLAARQFRQPAPGTAAAVFTNLGLPDDLAVTQTEFWDQYTAKQVVRWNLLCGTGVGNSAALIRMTLS